MASADIEKRGSVAVIFLDNPPVNALSAELRQALMAAIASCEADASVVGVVLAGRGRAFIAGADISEFDQAPKPPSFPELASRIEACAKPVVAAIHGHCLGGGLEMALGCHYRVAGPKANLGLPEVSLGLLPGGGGTQRLPRLVGAEKALELITTGASLSAAGAAAIGLVDEATEGDAVAVAVAWAERKAASPLPRLSERTVEEAPDWNAWRARLAKKSPGVEAPQLIVDAVQASVGQSFAQGQAEEERLFTTLLQGAQSAAQRHLFFAERQCAKVKDRTGVAPREVRTMGLVGGGTMGSGIAAAALNAGFSVVMVERDEGAIGIAQERVREAVWGGVARGKWSEAQAEARWANFSGAASYKALAPCELVVEAVFEDFGLKAQVFAELERVVPEGTVLASNTSYLDLDALAAGTGRPGDVVGMHFFSPAHVMKLLEVVRGKETDREVLATALAVAKRLRKVPVVAGVGPGFIGNRLYRRYQQEVGLLLLEGASPSQIDGAMTAWGMKMGPLAVNDLSGLDIGYLARKQAAGGHPFAFSVHDRLVEAGDKGRKTGAGFFRYFEGRAEGENESVTAHIEAARTAAGLEARSIDDETIVTRCLYALIDEGAHALEAGVARSAADIDVVYVNGYGFPRHRGGPMHHATAIGLDRVRDAIHALGWEPAPHLLQAATTGSWN